MGCLEVGREGRASLKSEEAADGAACCNVTEMDMMIAMLYIYCVVLGLAWVLYASERVSAQS